MARIQHPLARELRGDAYQALLRAAVHFCDAAGLVVRPAPMKLGDEGRRFVAELRPFVVREGDATEWPGTRLSKGTARLILVRLTPDAVELLATAVDGIYGWRQPDRPEDLSLLRPDGEPWLASVAREREALLRLDPDELDLLRKGWPILSGWI